MRGPFEMFQRVQGTHDAILVEAVSPVCPAKICPVRAVDLCLPLLRADTGNGKNRVSIDHALQNFGGGNVPAVIQGDAKLNGGAKALQNIQIVGHRNPILCVNRNMVVPGSPGLSACG